MVKVVLMSSQRTDFSSDSNGLILSELLAPTPAFSNPFLGRNPTRLGPLKIALKKNQRKRLRGFWVKILSPPVLCEIEADGG